MTAVSEKRKMVTVRNILVFLRDFHEGLRREGVDVNDVVAQFSASYGLPVEAADSMLDATFELGYIDEEDNILPKGLEYLEASKEIAPKLGVLTLIRGLPGAGKTELGKTILTSKKACGQTKVVHLESDQFMVDENGHYKFQLDKVKATNVECIAQTEKYLRMGWDVIVSNSFAQYWELKPYYDVAAYLNVKTVLIDMQSQFISERRSAKTRQAMVEKWDKVFLPRSWASHNKERPKAENVTEALPDEEGEV